MPLFVDQMNRTVEILHRPKRIISLVPSQTELLFDLGLADRVVGITKFCIHPAEQVKQVLKVGGTKQLNIEVIHSLKPDLIIANKEENEQSQIEALMQYCPVWISDINDLDSALDMIERVGQITFATDNARQIVSDIRSGFEVIDEVQNNISCVYLIWKNPYMAAGADTFINDMLQRCGFNNLVKEGRYPLLTDDELKKLNPDILLLSSEPYPFAEKHIQEFKKLLPNTRISLVDGELFSWYGSRLLYSPSYFISLMKKLLPNNEVDT
ncbi:MULTISPECIES: ABC transporter substrate-binding protein [unclassified Mucilaginibacter]|uniref:ABC transporter substrate-binding protein n=1 Tax=unclassified Mucilaginibacter TaxID=2617802 RepID=UPI000961DA76|nr:MULTISPECIES: helical backbone metal receptor [unclassified Mucilaginibacter]OJW18349.1 MAG: cobalamin-binding protein [Mucilaginibacter sp. 44-25]PLW91313.1 MAG: cobalamin-binding protein [Mucilaginibacter sp.]HEK21438.1 cobalamin-binding protein [Bacteroidota bacterium]